MDTYMVRYILAITLGMSENEEFIVEVDNNPSIIKCKHIEGITATSYLENNINWIKDTGTLAYVRSKNARGEEIDALKIYLNEDTELKCDGYVETSQHTVIDIILEANNRDEAVSKSEMAFEKFLSIYRYLFSEENVRLITTSDSKIVQVFKVGQLHQQNYWTEMVLEPLEPIIQWDNPFRRGLKSKKIDSQKIATFASILKSSSSMPLWSKIFLDTKDQAILNRNFSMSIVLVETAFECFVQNTLIKKCKEKNIQTLPDWKGKDIEVVEAVEGGNINRLINVYIPLITGNSVENTGYHRKWEENVCKKRNVIIHRGYIVNTEDEAKQSFIDAQNFINSIKQIL